MEGLLGRAVVVMILLGVTVVFRLLGRAVVVGLLVLARVVVGVLPPGVVDCTPPLHGLFGKRFVGPLIVSTIFFVRLNGLPWQMPLKSSVSIDQVRAPPNPITATY